MEKITVRVSLILESVVGNSPIEISAERSARLEFDSLPRIYAARDRFLVARELAANLALDCQDEIGFKKSKLSAAEYAKSEPSLTIGPKSD